MTPRRKYFKLKTSAKIKLKKRTAYGLYYAKLIWTEWNKRKQL